MAKGSFISDTFEQLAELGKSTAQKTGQAVKSLAVDTVKKAGIEMAGRASDTAQKKENFTRLDGKKLETRYTAEDSEKTAEVRRRLRHFLDLKKNEEQKAVEARKKEEEEWKKKNEEEEEKKKKTEAAKKQENPLPKGKERKSIFSPKKVAKRSQVETRAGSGKQ